jgi:hypothetical protein
MAWAGEERGAQRARGPGDASLTDRLRGRLEFLFSDANLRHDGHMRMLCAADGTAPFATLATFHRVAALGSTVEGLAEAARTSPLLRVSADGARVGRTVPYAVAPAGEVDAATVYCERLPLHAHHDSLAAYFARWGRVAYVSMPRYRGSRRCVDGCHCGVATSPVAPGPPPVPPAPQPAHPDPTPIPPPYLLQFQGVCVRGV